MKTAFTTDLMRKEGYLGIFGLKDAPRRTAFYRTGKRLSAGIRGSLTRSVLEGLI